MGSVNDGDVKFKDLAQAMYQFFGIKAKDCYRFYTDIRRRKTIAVLTSLTECRRS